VKQTIAFAALVFAVMLFWRHGLSVFALRHLWIAAAIAAVLLVPLAAVTLRFGSMDMDLATGVAASQGPHHLWSSLGYYAGLLPGQAGIVVLGLAVLFVVLEIVAPQRGWRDPLLVTSLVTFAVGYVFFTAIHLKDERYTIHILAPLALFAVAALYRLIPTRLAGPACFIFGLGVFAYGTTNTPIDRYIAGRLIHAPILSLAARHWFTDTTNGFRAYSVGYLRDPRVAPFRDVFAYYELLFYLTVRAPQLKYRVTEIAVTRRYPPDTVPTKISGWSGRLHMLKELFGVALGQFHPR